MDISELIARNNREVEAQKAAQAQAGTTIYKKVYSRSITINSARTVLVQFASSDGTNPIGTLGVDIDDQRSFDYPTAKFACSPIVFQAVQMATGSIGWSAKVDFTGASGSITLNFQLVTNTDGSMTVS